MNYRHHFHAGNFADVAKHALLVRLARALQKKPKGFLYLDTHAGRGGYDLSAAAAGDTQARTPEWPEGIGRLWQQRGIPEALGEYVELVRSYDRSRGNLSSDIRFYPGSPALIQQLARPADRMALCEKQAAECAALKDALGRGRARADAPRFSVQEIDGYVAMRSMLPPPERRALTLIDPPYEAQDEFAQAADALGEALRRFPTGVFALWYPLTERARVQEFLHAVEALRPPPTLLAELAIAGDYSPRKMKGCGLAVLNPPWGFEAEAREILAYLANVLAVEPGGGSSLTWLAPER